MGDKVPLPTIVRCSTRPPRPTFPRRQASQLLAIRSHEMDEPDGQDEPDIPLPCYDSRCSLCRFELVVGEKIVAGRRFDHATLIVAPLLTVRSCQRREGFDRVSLRAAPVLRRRPIGHFHPLHGRVRTSRWKGFRMPCPVPGIHRLQPAHEITICACLCIRALGSRK